MKVSVVVPTYEERDNIKLLVERIAEAVNGRDYEIVVVDDNSPDATAEVAASLSQEYPIKLIRRERKLGLASAILDGFGHSSGEIVGVIDADLQHPPEVIADLVDAIEQGCDIAVASRHALGGEMEDWSLLRRVVSKGAILLTKPLTKVKDPTSGFFFVRKRLVGEKRFTPIGYKILLELLVEGGYDSVKEVPYTFRNRQMGKSKLGLGEYGKYLVLLFRLYLVKARRTLSRWRTTHYEDPSS